MSYDEYLNRRIKIVHVSKTSYTNDGIILGLYGTIKRISSNNIGVLVDGKNNMSSGYGVYWFKWNELKIIEDESEEMKMTGFNKVAIVNLLEDYNKKDYAFALYDTEYEALSGDGDLVVVNARGKDNRVLGVVKDVMSLEEYGKGVNAQVVAVVNMDAYNARIEEENKAKEVAKKKAAIEKELKEEINKRKTVEFYEEMAKKYSDNPRLAELVEELKGLSA